jgi:hypothetical protein
MNEVILAHFPFSVHIVLLAVSWMRSEASFIQKHY